MEIILKSENINTEPTSEAKSDVDCLVIAPTHTELVKIAKKWLAKTCGCGVVFSELVTSAIEVPDALGLRSDYTILVECKTSRSDFLADQKKIFRQLPEEGMGDFRFYLCEPDLIKIEDLPERWGLLYWDGKRVKKIRAPKGNIWLSQKEHRFNKNVKAEHKIMYSALRRIELRGDLDKIYEAL